MKIKDKKMESPALIKNAVETSKNPSKILLSPKTIFLIVFLIILTLLLTAILSESSLLRHDQQQQQQKDHPTMNPSAPVSSLHPVLKKTCATTLYPSLCITTLSSIPASKNITTPQQILELTIIRTLRSVNKSSSQISCLSIRKGLNSLEKNALKDCMEMLDQTLYELRQAKQDLHDFPPLMGSFRRSYGNLKTLLSAAMTNENTCIDGFSDVEEADTDNQKGLKEYLQRLLTPISCMISNCLAMVKYMETNSQIETVNKGQEMLISKIHSDDFPVWPTASGRNLMEFVQEIRPDAIVAGDGSGDYRTIGEAVRMAPNMSISRFVIKIKAGVYKENVDISREKMNIMLVGDGMNSTMILGCKNFLDGFSTFTSATLTVVGDKFLARDLTIINSSGPQKHQAVALRVTSNSAFYRCNITSYQDTLYAHSLRQFYRECVIEGTIDFIFGNAAAVFQNCLILARKPNPRQKNMITAQGREDPNQNTGISLHNCTIAAAADLTAVGWDSFATFLGRPWRNYSRTMVMKSYLGELIHPQGWYKWNEYSTLDTVDYIEYRNMGPGSNTRGRVTWGGYRRNCSEDIAMQFTVREFLHGADDWLQSTGFPFFYGP